jgi:NAD(P)-dependent dehydrogenase (short-subunit alcohol dehydrogenase family)
MCSLENKTILVTGGSSGIGRGTVDVLLAAGASVAVAARRNVADMPDGVLQIACDVADSGQVNHAVEETIRYFGRLDGLFANAGIVIYEDFLETSDETWDRTINTNLGGVFRAIRAAARHMAAQGRGSIVVNSSVRAVASSPMHAAYSASKGGMDALVVQLATELGPKGIRINSLHTGAARSEMLSDAARLFTGGDEEKLNASFVHMIPLGRVGEPEEIGRLVTFLLSDAASYITGVLIPADGGMLCRLV